MAMRARTAVELALQRAPGITDREEIWIQATRIRGESISRKLFQSLVCEKDGRLCVSGEGTRAYGTGSATAPRNERGEIPKPLATPQPAALDFSRFIPKSIPNYQPRWIGCMKESEYLTDQCALKRAVLLEGDTGSGKSAMVRQYTAMYGLPLLVQDLSQGCDETILIGSYALENRQTVWQDGVLTYAMRHGLVLLLEEINALDGGTATATHTAIHERTLILQQNKYERIVAKEGFFLVATQNPGYQGTRPLNPALRSRFTPVTIGYDPKVEKAIVGNNAKLLAFVKVLRDARETGVIHTPVSTRLLARFVEDERRRGPDMALFQFVQSFEPEDQKVVKEHIQVVFGKIIP